MDEEEKRRITWFANKLVKKNVQLPFLRRPASGDQFSTLIESVDHLLTESHRRRELLLPELTAFNNKSVGVFSDYSGEGSGRYNVYSILVCGMNMTSGFHDAVTKVRSEHALGDKEISFKDLNMGQISRALPSFLEAADQLPGLLYTVAIEKGIRSVFGSEPDTPKKIVNPRRTFEDAALKELAESIRAQGVLSPLLVRPLTENGFEIVFGERRYRAAQIAGQETVPVRIRKMSDAEALEAQLVENLIRSEIHPMEEAQGFRALLGLEEPKYSIEQIAAKVGKSPAFVASRLKLTDLVPEAVEAFYADEIGVGHALLLAKLPADQQKQALAACFKEVYSGNSQKPARILLPVRNLQFWIDSNILLVLKDAPFNKRDAQLVPAAGSCADCSKRTGHNKVLFGDDLGKQGDRCTNPTCYQAKVQAHVAATIAAKPELVQISTAYGAKKEGRCGRAYEWQVAI